MNRKILTAIAAALDAHMPSDNELLSSEGHCIGTGLAIAKERWINEHVEIRQNAKCQPPALEVYHVKVDGVQVAMVVLDETGTISVVDQPGESQLAIRIESIRKELTMSDPDEKGAEHAGHGETGVGELRDPGGRRDEHLDVRFTYHAPRGDQEARYVALRATAKEFAEEIVAKCPPSRERSLALTNLEQAIMWSNASIGRNE